MDTTSTSNNMKINKMDEDSKKDIHKTVKLIFDLFEFNGINYNLGLNACIACIFSFMKNNDVKQDDFERIMDLLKQQYSLNTEL